MFMLCKYFGQFQIYVDIEENESSMQDSETNNDENSFPSELVG